MSIGMKAKIKSGYSSLRPSEKRIADYLLDHKLELAEMDISDLAEKTKTSKTTVSRFCRRMGFGGFKQFRLYLASEGITVSDQSKIIRGGKAFEIIENICKSNSEASMDTMYLLKPEELEEVAKGILKAKKIFLIGDGGVASVIVDFYQKLLRLGILANYSFDRRIQKMQVAIADKDDMIIAFGFSGESMPTVEALADGMKNGAKGISICCSIGSPLGKKGDISLYGIGQRVDEHSTGTIEPRISLLCIIDALFYMMLSIMPKGKSEKYLQKTRNAIIDDWR